MGGGGKKYNIVTDTTLSGFTEASGPFAAPQGCGRVGGRQGMQPKQCLCIETLSVKEFTLEFIMTLLLQRLQTGL